MRAKNVVALVIVLLMVSGAFAVLASAPMASANQGAKDTYGYRWTDSKSPAPQVTYNWIEMNATGTPWNPNTGDVVAGPYALGFTFNFYGNNYTQVYIGSNGLIGFGSSTQLTDYYNDNIPNSNTPNNYIAAYWDELHVYNPYAVYYGSVGAAPDRQFVIEWAGATEWNYGSSPLYFEILLNETGDIWMQYQTLNGRTGSSATVGIENSAGTAGCLYGYNSGSLQNSLAIKFSRGYVTTTPSTHTHTVASGTTTTYTVTVQNLQNVSDSFRITATSSLGWSVTVCNASTLLALMDTDADTFPDTGTLAPMASMSIQINVTVPASPVSSPDVTTINASSHATPLRFSTSTVTTNAFGAWLTPPHTDWAYDHDGDGQANHLVFNVSLYVRQTGYYYIYGYLYTSTESYLAFQSNGTTYSTTGSKMMQLWYNPWIIRNSGIDGPYHVHLDLYDNSGNLLSTGIHNTSAYSYTDFQDEPGYITTPFSEYMVDTDSNGLYNYLQANITVHVDYAGQFRLDADLHDAGGNGIQSQTNTTYLTVGTHTISFRWDYMTIRNYAYTYGQFRVYYDLYAYVDGSLYTMPGAGSSLTRSYTFAQLDRPGAIFGTSHSDYATDFDSDYTYEVLLVNVSVNVTVEGDYTITGDLYEWVWYIMTDSNTTHLTVGEHIVQLVYEGWTIYDTYDDPETVDLYLEDASSNELDTDTYTLSQYYYYWDFISSPALLGSVHNDYGLDTDADGDYEWLIVEVNVSVMYPCTLRVHGDLECPYWSYLTDADNTTFLGVGYHMVQLKYPGWILYNDGHSGTLHMDYAYLYDQLGNELDYDWWYMGSYNYDEWEGPPGTFSTGHTSYAWCDDADGLYEWLTINVSVDVTDTGRVWLWGELEETSGYNTVSLQGTIATTTSTGIQTIQLSFPGWLINRYRYNGTYYAYMTMAQDRDNALDWDGYYTGYYYWDDFDPTVPSITSGWSTSAPTINGAYDSAEWAGATSVSLGATTIMNGVMGTVYIKNDASRLYVLIDAWGDLTADPNDRASISFDCDDNDRVTTGMDDQFIVYASGASYHYVGSGTTTWASHCSPISISGLNHSGLAGDAGFGTSSGHATNHRIYEYSIPLNLLNVTAGDSLGFLVGSRSYNGLYDYGNGTNSLWPAIGDFSITSFGNLVLASTSSIPGAPVTTAVVAATAGANGWYRSAATVTFARAGGAGGVDYTEYRLDGGAWTNFTAGISITAEGEHTLEFRSMDNMSQLEGIKNVSVNIDITGPETVAGKSGGVVWLNATDATSGIRSIWYRVDGGSWLNYTGQITITGVGNHTVDYYSEDFAGNKESTQSTVVQIKEKSGGAGILSGGMLWIILAIVAVVAAMLILFLVLKRRKGPQQQMMPPSAYQYQQMPPPQQGPQMGPPPSQ